MAEPGTDSFLMHLALKGTASASTRKHGVEKHNLLRQSRLYGDSVGALSGGKTRKRVQAGTVKPWSGSAARQGVLQQMTLKTAESK
jgi:hypothetical protein